MHVIIKQSDFDPAEDLTLLTWSQVIELDAKIASLCAYAAATGKEVALQILINRNGKPYRIGDPLKFEKFNPV